MPRPERPLDDEDGPLARFATDLRQLRQSAGGLTYRAMAKEANYSATVLSEAASGRKLPSLHVTVAYVRACGGDPDEWTARWQALADGERAAAEPPPPEELAEPRSRRGRLVVVAAAVVAVVLVAALALLPDDDGIVMPEDVAAEDVEAVPEPTEVTGEPPPGLPCSTRDRAEACVDLRQRLVWVRDLPPSDRHHASVYWATTDGSVRGECHNVLSATGPWVTCPYTDSAREPGTLGFRSAVEEEDVVLEWGPYISVPVNR
jgi:helix-turn-helix protein